MNKIHPNQKILTEGYFFTPEQLNEYTANVITTTLKTAAEKVDITYTIEKTFDFTEVDKQSITDTFEETFKKFFVSL